MKVMIRTTLTFAILSTFLFGCGGTKTAAPSTVDSEQPVAPQAEERDFSLDPIDVVTELVLALGLLAIGRRRR